LPPRILALGHGGNPPRDVPREDDLCGGDVVFAGKRHDCRVISDFLVSGGAVSCNDDAFLAAVFEELGLCQVRGDPVECVGFKLAPIGK
jgi:hypothetical protein